MHWSDATHFLCLRFDACGDLAVCAPAFKALKAAGPSRRITLLTSPACLPLAQRLDEVDNIILYDPPWLSLSSEHEAIADRRMITRLDAQDFDAAIIFTKRGESPLPAALMCTLADIPLRLGRGIEHPGGLLTHWLRDTPAEDGASEAQRQLAMVRSIERDDSQPYPHAANDVTLVRGPVAQQAPHARAAR
ncbi:MAG: hypothetical protein QM639_10290 [Rhodocyclaceae bacterium]